MNKKSMIFGNQCPICGQLCSYDNEKNAHYCRTCKIEFN